MVQTSFLSNIGDMISANYILVVSADYLETIDYTAEQFLSMKNDEVRDFLKTNKDADEIDMNYYDIDEFI